MKTPFIVCSLFVLLFLSSVETAYGCTCVEDINAFLNQKVRDAFRNTAAVFAGKVIRIDTKSQPLFVLITIQVFEAWKGNIPPTITIATNKGAEDCEFPFVLKADYLIDVIGEPNALSTNICLTTLISNTPDSLILNKITKGTFLII